MTSSFAWEGDEHASLLTLSDIRTLGGLRDAASRVAAIADILAERRDPRGVFPLIYRIGLEAVAAAVEDGRFRDPDWVQTFDVAFAGRYLDNLHRHLCQARTTPPWAAANRHVDTDPAAIAGAVAAALNAHLISDLPEALHASSVRARHVFDYQTLSRLIWQTAPAAIAEIERRYGTDLSPLYYAPPLTWLDTALPGGVPDSQERLFHSITGLAFAQGLALANPLARPLIRAQIAAGSQTLIVAVDQLTRKLRPRSVRA
ncbi:MULTISPECIES: DUF5995 family protein [unclassified Mycobacterium]|uniref:DUF5995 family protein n=1 Tax=unclassified Mycobacterium TaxID=2642494 RepID=UPI00074023E6|nr:MULTISPECIES: DUF5995 family protein [unclassified Mycobacterium]KUH85596.1 hypothetical protein AU186_22890 [Mycobacterium sp. GA-1999]KUH91454.1 hypothetical protein AU185_09955 [Mycobacterium sp. GA-0227b]KUH96293.1 hypothetical protein AU187_13890 [Mycobacterium sp. IS-1556]